MKKKFLLLICSFLMAVGVASCGSNKPKSCKVSMLHMHPQYQERERNINTICEYATEAFSNGANIVVAPEMSTDFYYVTEDDVRGYAGVHNIESELSAIANVAKNNKGYIVVGFPEIAEDNTLYNSAVMFNKEGKVVLHERKRCLPSWNSIGDLPYAVYDSEFGKLGIIICADSYIPDHAKALKELGADIILSPVTWYPTDGHNDDDNINAWTARAIENEVWYVVCNRWGEEIKDLHTEDMNGGISCVINPKGEVVFSYMAGNNFEDKILYYEINR